MKRCFFETGGRRLSYLDSEAGEDLLIALHSHWMEAHTFSSFAQEVCPRWRVVALDQRGHGFSDHATTYAREDYLSDLRALYHHLDCDSAVLLGNSLGGVNAYQFAANHPSLVRAMIIEDIGVEIADDTSIALEWKGVFGTVEALELRVGQRFAPYLRDSIRSVRDGWTLAFDPDDMLTSQRHINGNHWSDWLASDCPALVLRGSTSRVTNANHLRDMASRRPNTVFRELEGGHVLHFDNLPAVLQELHPFLDGLEPEAPSAQRK